MKEETRLYTIPFTGLSDGQHTFDFEIDETFFQAFENEDLKDSRFSITVDLLKEPAFMELDIHFKGEFVTECDRCLEQLTLPISGSRHMVAKHAEPQDDEDIIALKMAETALELSRAFYETLAVELPLKRAHEVDKCNPDVLERLDTYERGDEEEPATFDRWGVL